MAEGLRARLKTFSEEESPMRELTEEIKKKRRYPHVHVCHSLVNIEINVLKRYLNMILRQVGLGLLGDNILTVSQGEEGEGGLSDHTTDKLYLGSETHADRDEHRHYIYLRDISKNEVEASDENVSESSGAVPDPPALGDGGKGPRRY